MPIIEKEKLSIACVHESSSFSIIGKLQDPLNMSIPVSFRYLTRGWCQLEILAALCPALIRRKDEYSKDEYTFLDHETTRLLFSSVCSRAKFFVHETAEEFLLDSKYVHVSYIFGIQKKFFGSY